MPALPNLMPTQQFTWNQGSIGAANLPDGRAAINWNPTAIQTMGGQQLGLLCFNDQSPNVIFQIAWQPDTYVASLSEAYDASLAAAAAAGGFTQYTASVAEYVIPQMITINGESRGFVIWIPAASPAAYIGVYADPAAGVSQGFTVKVVRQNNSAGMRNV